MILEPDTRYGGSCRIERDREGFRLDCELLIIRSLRYGYDIDSDGGPVCTTRDIVHSDLFEVVQVFGFDPQNIW